MLLFSRPGQGGADEVGVTGAYWVGVECRFLASRGRDEETGPRDGGSAWAANVGTGGQGRGSLFVCWLCFLLLFFCCSSIPLAAAVFSSRPSCAFPLPCPFPSCAVSLPSPSLAVRYAVRFCFMSTPFLCSLIIAFSLFCDPLQ